MTDRVRVAGQYNATPPTLGDGDAAPLQFDSTGKLLIATSGAAAVATQLSSVAEAGWLVTGPGSLRVLSCFGSNGNLYEDGIPAYLVLFDLAYTPGPVLPPGAPLLALGSETPMAAGADVLGAAGWTFALGCIWGWSSSPNAMVPFGGDPASRRFFAAFTFVPGA